MKTLILISALLAVSATNLFAQQNNAIELKNLQKEVINNDNNEFKIFSNEELEVDLNFNLNKFESYMVVIFNDKDQIVYTKKIGKEGKNIVYFTTKPEKEYTVKLYNENDKTLVALMKTK